MHACEHLGRISNTIAKIKKNSLPRAMKGMDSEESCIWTSPSKNEDLMDQSKKKKRRKYREFDVPAASSTMIDSSDEPLTKKPKKKKKSEEFDEDPLRESITTDVMLSPIGEEEENEATRKKKSKKKKKERQDLPGESAVGPTISTELVAPSRDGEAESSHVKKKKKKRDRPEESSEEISVPAKSSDTNQELGPDILTGTNSEEVIVTPEILSGVEPESEPDPESPRRRKSVKRRSEVSSSLMDPPNLDDLDEASKRAMRECPGPPEENPHLLHLPRDANCPYCNKELKNVKYRNLHVRVVHLKEKKYECEVCKARFGDKSTLRVHRRVHQAERDYDCPYCPEKFRNKKNLNQHKGKHLRRADSDHEPAIETSQSKRRKKPKEKTPEKQVIKEMTEEEDNEIVERLVALSKNQQRSWTS